MGTERMRGRWGCAAMAALAIAACVTVIGVPGAGATSGMAMTPGMDMTGMDMSGMSMPGTASAKAKPKPAAKKTSPAKSTSPTRAGLQGTYFDSAALQHPVLTRTDRKIDFAWGKRTPQKQVKAAAFSARWSGFVTAPKTGKYTLYVKAGGGARLFIDGKRVVNRWAAPKHAKEASVSLKLKHGRHAIRLEYRHLTGTASVRLSWSGPGIKKRVISGGSLSSPAASKPAFTAATPDGPAQAWSDPKTWGGAVPVDGTAVTIPAGKTVLLDRDVSLANLTIHGTLEFARQDLTLSTDWIVSDGTLEIGTAAKPFTQHATIRITDVKPGENVMGMGDKVLAVQGGALELHGAHQLPWTRLNATAAEGANQITLAQAPDWHAGDQIAIASTDYESDQAEQRTITAVSGATVTLDQPLVNAHYGQLQSFDGHTVDERAEVALLTRTVTFEGDPDTSTGGVGAYVMIMAGAAHISDTQFVHVGQLGILRRYAIHFHMLGNGGVGSYVRSSSVHQSFNRCITIHGTNGVALTGNDCYDEVGHGIFLEDGAETGNDIEGNLVFGTHAAAKAKAILPTDTTPASYWITNPDNTVKGNVAAGSDGHGFWLAFPEHPTGLFATTFPALTAAIWNRRTALAAFATNTAHSNGNDGLHLDDGPNPDGTTGATYYEPLTDPANEKSAALTTPLPGMTAWKNRGTGVWLRGSGLHLTGATIADNANGAQFAASESMLQNSVVVGETANTGTPASWEAHNGDVGPDGRSLARPWDADFPIRGFSFYDGRVGVEGTTFVNFRPYTAGDGTVRQESALGYDVKDDFSINPHNYVSGARFVNALPVYLQTPMAGHDGDESAVFLDSDGSVTGTAGRSVTTNNPFLFGSACAWHADWNAQECTGDYASLRVQSTNSHAGVDPVTVTRPDGQVQTLHASSGDGDDSATTSVLTGSTYTVGFNGGTPASTEFVLANGQGRRLKVAIPHAAGFHVTKYGCDVSNPKSWCSGAAASSAALDAATHSGYWYDSSSGILYLRLVADATTGWEQLEVGP